MSRRDIEEFVGVVLFVGCASAVTAGIVVIGYVTGGYIGALVGGVVVTIALLVAAEEWRCG